MDTDVAPSIRTIDGNHDTIDVHGTTVAEATVIVKEILDEEGPSISQSGFLSLSYYFTEVHLLLTENLKCVALKLYPFRKVNP